MMIPARGLLLALLGLSLAGALTLLVRGLWPAHSGLAETAWWAAVVLLGLGCGIDALRAWRGPVPAVQRQLPSALSVLRPHRIDLLIENRHLPPGTLIADHHPGDDADTGLPCTLTPTSETNSVLSYRYRPARRGIAEFGLVELWLPSPWRLWTRRAWAGQEARVPVFPDFSMLSREQLLAQDRVSKDQGARLQSRRGEGLEFHQLREYRPGDSLRQIDWKASARRRSLISREYQEEQNQQIIMLLDGGQRLAMKVDELSGFDHALNACLLLAWNAIRESDRPGALVFSADQPCWVPPSRGRSSINQLLHALYPLHPSRRASDYSDAARLLLGHQRHHALVVLVTQLQPDDEEDLLTAIRLIGKRHRLMVADVQLPRQLALRDRLADSEEQAWFCLGDAAWMEQRRAMHLRLRHAGVTVVQAPPQKLAATLNRAYLTMKRSGQL